MPSRRRRNHTRPVTHPPPDIHGGDARVVVSLSRDTTFENLTIGRGTRLDINGYRLNVRRKLTIEGDGRVTSGVTQQPRNSR